jgi:hypothetical protein
MHTITGSDITSKLFGRSKDLHSNFFFETINDIILQSLALLGEEHVDMEIGYCCIEQFICKLHKSPYSTIEEVFFSNKQAHENALPPTKAALQQHILRSRFQSAVWKALSKLFPKLAHQMIMVGRFLKTFLYQL